MTGKKDNNASVLYKIKTLCQTDIEATIEI